MTMYLFAQNKEYQLRYDHVPLCPEQCLFSQNKEYQ